MVGTAGRRRAGFAAVACIGAAALWVVPAPALAQQTTEVNGLVRRELLDQAQQASLAGDHVRALELATRAGALGMTPSVRLFVSEQHEALGQLVEAYASAAECVRVVQTDETVRNRDVILARCQQLVDSLRTRVARVVVRAPAPAPPGLEITVAGAALDPALFGVPYVVSAGRVLVEARDAAGETFRQEILASEGGAVDVTVRLEPAATAPARVEPIAPSPGPVAVLPPPPPPPAAPSRVGPALAAGAGVIAFGAAALFALLRNDAVSALDATCGAPDADGVRHCPDTASARDAHGRDVSYSIAADVALGVGLVGVAAGVAWWFVSRGSGERTPRTPSAMVAPLPGGVWVGMGGRL